MMVDSRSSASMSSSSTNTYLTCHDVYLYLVQRDSTLARMLFASLFESVFAEVDYVLTDREAESTKRAVRDGLNAVMEASTLFHPPFIGSLQVS